MIQKILFLLFILATTDLKAQATDEPDSYSVVVPDKKFKPLNLDEVKDSIGYPNDAIDMNLEETIIYRTLIDESGNYIRHIPPKIGHPILRRAIEPYLPLIRFEPATKEGKPIKFWVNIPFIFKL